MQDLSKIEQEHLQANDVGDDAPDGLTREFAEGFLSALQSKMHMAALQHFVEGGMTSVLSSGELQECFLLLKDHLHDACGDMPIWDIVKRGEA